MNADLIVIGAGPAGSIAGYEASKIGLKTIIIDKEDFPRDKPCGGGLTANSVDFLLENNLMHLLDGIEKFSFNGYRIYSDANQMVQAPMRSKIGAKEGFVIRRSDFDNSLLKNAINAGCKFLPSHKAESVNQGKKEVEVLTSKANMQGKAIVVADGSGMSLTKKILPSVKPANTLAVAAFYENIGLDTNDLLMVCDKNMVAGYGWIFKLPGNKANIGAGADIPLLKERNMSVKDYFNEFIVREPVKNIIGKGVRISKIRSFPLNMDYSKAVFKNQNALFAGDAANLIYPLSGEGISYAMSSGKIAAEVAAKAIGRDDLKVLEEYPVIMKKYFKNFRFAVLFKKYVTCSWFQNYLFNTAVKDEYFCEKALSIFENTYSFRELLSPKISWKLFYKGLFTRLK